MDSDSATCGAAVQHARFELSSCSPEMSSAGVFFAYSQNSGSVYVTNVRFYYASHDLFRYEGEHFDLSSGIDMDGITGLFNAENYTRGR
jgi:hypothetical protein